MNRILLFSRLALIGIFLCAAGTAQAKELTWSDVVDQAKAHNPALKKAGLSLQQSRERYNRTLTAFLPQLSANASGGQGDSDNSSSSRNYSYGLSGSLSLFSGFSDLSASKSARIGILIAELSYQRTLSDVLYTLRQSFINLLWAQDSVALSQQIAERRNENFDLIQLKYDAGTADKGSLLRIDADRTQAYYDLDKANRNLKTASFALATAIGNDDYGVLTVTGSYAASRPPADAAPRELAEKTPEFRIARFSADQAALSVTSARSGFYPSLSLSASRSRSGSAFPPDENSSSVRLGLSWSFFPGGRNFVDVSIAALDRSLSLETLRQTRQSLTSRVMTAQNSYTDAWENTGIREKYLAASREQSRISTAKYVNGLISYQDWYTIENDFINSERALLNARRDAILAEAQFNNILGKQE